MALHPQVVKMRSFGIVTAVAVAVVLFIVADRLLQPAPIPAAGGVLGGIVGLWLTRSRSGVMFAVAFGIGVGTAIHLYTHVTGGSPAPVEGLFLHVAGDAAIGLAVTLPIIAVTTLITVVVEKHVGRGQDRKGI